MRNVRRAGHSSSGLRSSGGPENGGASLRVHGPGGYHPKLSGVGQTSPVLSIRICRRHEPVGYRDRARNVPIEQLLNPQVVGPGGAYANWLTDGTVSAAGIGPAGTDYPGISLTTLFQTAR